VAAKAAWMRTLPTARLEVIRNSRHATPVDQPHAFLGALVKFLAEQG
jgi:pimeloyl-ACP methyl ester carboxylesterase